MEISAHQLQNQVLLNCIPSNYRIFPCLDRIYAFLGHCLVYCLECSVGLHIGAVAGWLSGWCTALAYRHYCQPTNFISVDVMSKWHHLPYQYGRGGLLAGAIAGTIVVAMLMAIKSAKPIETDEIETNE